LDEAVEYYFKDINIGSYYLMFHRNQEKYDNFISNLRAILMAHDLVDLDNSDNYVSPFTSYLIDSHDQDPETQEIIEKALVRFGLPQSYPDQVFIIFLGLSSFRLSRGADRKINLFILKALREKFPEACDRSNLDDLQMSVDINILNTYLPKFSAFLDTHPTFYHKYKKFTLLKCIEKINAIAAPKGLLLQLPKSTPDEEKTYQLSLSRLHRATYKYPFEEDRKLVNEYERTHVVTHTPWFCEASCAVVLQYYQQKFLIDRLNDPRVDLQKLQRYTPLPNDLGNLVIQYLYSDDEEFKTLIKLEQLKRPEYYTMIIDFSSFYLFYKSDLTSAQDTVMDRVKDYFTLLGLTANYHIPNKPFTSILLSAICHPFFLRDLKDTLDKLPSDKLVEYQKQCGTYQEPARTLSEPSPLRRHSIHQPASIPTQSKDDEQEHKKCDNGEAAPQPGQCLIM